MNPMSQKTEFLQRFADKVGMDSDSLIDLYMRLDTTAGLTCICNTNSLYFSIVLDGIAHPVLEFELRDLYTRAFLDAYDLKKFLSEHGIFEFETDEFLKAFIRYTCMVEDEKLYLDLNRICEETDYFISLIEDFMKVIYL